MLILCTTALCLDGEAEVKLQHDLQENWQGDPRGKYERRVKTQRGH